MPVAVHLALLIFQCELIEKITATLLNKTGQIKNSKKSYSYLNSNMSLFSAILQWFFPFILNYHTGFLNFYVLDRKFFSAKWTATGTMEGY